MPVITISRQLGSGAIYIAQQLANQLNFRYIDKELIVKVAQLANVTPDKIEHFDQDEFNQIKTIFSQMPFPIPGSGIMYPFTAIAYMEPALGGYPGTFEEGMGIDDRRYLQLTQTVIRNFAEEGNVIIMGRGGCILLKDFPQTVHLRIIAPLERRIEWATQEDPNIDKSKAKEIIEQKDKARAEYLKHFYNANWDNPLFYHLILNTGHIALDDAVKIITSLVELTKKK
ncbi:MAG: AAA family ATPase [bacterium]